MSSSIDISPVGYSDGLVSRIGETWYTDEGANLCRFETSIVERELVGQLKVKDGFELSFAGSVKFKSKQEVKLQFSVVKLDTDGKDDSKDKWTFMGAELSAVLFTRPVLDFTVGPVKFSGTVHVTVAGKIEPDYTAIAELALEKAIIPSSGVARVAQMVSSALTADVLIVAGLAAGRVMTIVAVAKGIATGAEERGLSKLVDSTTDALTEGFVAGAWGGGAPGNPAAGAGHAMGQKGFAALRPRAQQAVRESWAAANTGFMDRGNLKFGYTNTFGRMPSESDPNYTRYSDA